MLHLLKLLFVIFLPFVSGLYYEDAQRLRKDLFQNYSNEIRPTHDFNEPTLIKAILNIYVVYDLIIKTGHLVTRSILQLDWQDDNLMWNPENYGNISLLYPTSVKPWMPDVVVCNSEEESKKTSDQKYGLVIHADGYVIFWQSMILRTFCVVDIYTYPFDKQECEIYLCTLLDDPNHTAFGSFQVELHLSYDNNNWDIEIGETNNSTRSDTVVATLYLSRKADFSSVANILPALVLSILTLCIFLLPAESGEKVSLATTVFLSNVVYLVEMDRALDANSNRPALVIMYLIALTSLSGLGTIGAIIVCKVHLSENDNGDADEKEGDSYCGGCCKKRTASISIVSEGRGTGVELDKIPSDPLHMRKKKTKGCGHRQLDTIFLAIGCIMFLIFAIIFGHFFTNG